MAATLETCKPLIDRIVATSGSSLTLIERRDATRQLLGAVSSHVIPSQRLEQSVPFDENNPLLLPAVFALKLLGRDAQGTEDLAAEQGLQMLIRLSGLDTRHCVIGADSDNLSPMRNEAIRCLANVCLLHESARIRLGTFENLPEAILAFGQTSKSTTSRFLAARILFLLTASGGEVVRLLVEDLNIAGHLADQLSHFIKEVYASESKVLDDSSTSALTEYLKTVFNVALHYPRYRSIITSQNSESANAASAKVRRHQASTNGSSNLVPPSQATAMIRRPSSSASTSSSLSVESNGLRSRSPRPSAGRIHGSPNQQAAKKLKGLFDRATCRTSSSDGAAKKASAHSTNTTVLNVDEDMLDLWCFGDVVSGLVELSLCLPYGDGLLRGPFGVHKHLITALLNVAFAAYQDTFFARESPGICPHVPPLPMSSPSTVTPDVPVLPGRLLSLLDHAMRTYSPFSFDDDAAREIALAAPEPLDETFSFLLLLLAKFAAEDTVGDTRRALRSILLADDIDRSIGLEQRKDLTGRLVRLMGSSYMPACNDAAGKLLFAICDQDPALFSSILGYGNAAGFLRSLGMLIPPSSVSATNDTASYNSAAINPITGAFEDPTLRVEAALMTEEEKEREAERLFVLFDRMNKNAAISVDHPVRDAHQAGRMEKSAAQLRDDAQRFQEFEAEEEAAALAELQRYKEKKSGGP